MAEAGQGPAVVQKSAVEAAAEVEEDSKVCKMSLAHVGKTQTEA
jgi:hypothetical protein